MRRSALVFFLILVAAVASSKAQSAESAEARRFTISAGGMVSGFNPHDSNNPFYYTNGSKLIGIGTFVDMHVSHWVQVEAEGRWLKWNGYGGTEQSNYLIGLRVPVKQIGQRTQIYGKTLVGYGKMTFASGYGYGSFTDVAFGGTLEYRLSRKLTLRAADFEYQYWPVWLGNKSLSPYGVSVGVAYRVF